MEVIMVRDLLMLSPKLMPLPSPDMEAMVMEAMAADTEAMVDIGAMVAMEVIMARDLLMLSPKLMPLPSLGMVATVDMEAMVATEVDMEAMAVTATTMARDLLRLTHLPVMEVMAAMVIMVKLTNINLDKSSMFFSLLIQE